jgi:hypothetical protein
METGIARKSGNADGAKVSTAMNVGGETFPIFQRWRRDGQ